MPVLPFLRSTAQFLPMVIAQNIGQQKLARIPEPKSVTDDEPNVLQYDQVLTTKLTIPYAVAIQTIYRSHSQATGGTACDLACGPGHFTLLLNQFLHLNYATGLDLSKPMIEVARKNAPAIGLANAEFQVADITNLDSIPDQAYDITTCTDAAHHFDSIEQLRSIVQGMERITQPNGTIVIMDLVRLRTERLTNRYVQTVGADYEAAGLDDFYEDFRNSMLAAWTTSEFRGILPPASPRSWFHVVPFGLPSLQILLGLPTNRRSRHQRRGTPWTSSEHPVPQSMRHEFHLVQSSLRATRIE